MVAAVAFRTLGDTFAAWVDAAPAEIGWVSDNGDGDPVTVTRAEMMRRACGVANRLVETGVRPGQDSILLTCDFGTDFVAGFLGCQLLRCPAVPSPFNARSTEGTANTRLATIRKVMASRFVVCDQAQAAPLADVLTGIIPVPVADDVPSTVELAIDIDDYRTPPLIAKRLAAMELRDVAFVQFTSGSTSLPKGCIISHRAALANATLISERTGLSARGESYGLNWCPQFHDLGLMNSVLLPITAPHMVSVLLNPRTFALRPQRWMELASTYNAFISAGPNTALEYAAKSATRLDPDIDLSGLEMVVTGAEPVNPTTVEDFERVHAPFGLAAGAVRPAYGLAEATLLVTLSDGAMITLDVDQSAKDQGRVEAARPGKPSLRLASSGTATGNVEVRITTGRSVSQPGEIGEIEVRSTALCDCYVTVDGSVSVTNEQGWLPTGDLGFLDNGQLFVTGRSKDLIIVAGRNIDPNDLEHAIARQVSVRGAIVATQTHSDGATYVVIETRLAKAADAQRETAAVIAHEFNLPVHVLAVPPGAIPRTTSGKVQRRRCAELIEHGTLSCHQ